MCADPVNNPGLGFTLSGAFTTTSSPTVSLTDVGCANDYLMIPCGSDLGFGQFINSDFTPCATKLCGGVFSSINAQVQPRPVTSKSLESIIRNRQKPCHFVYLQVFQFHSNCDFTLMITKRAAGIKETWDFA